MGNKNSFMPKAKTTLVVVTALVVTFGCLSSLKAPKASAATAAFTKAYVRLDRVKTGVASTARVCATPSATNLAQTENAVIVNFPSTFTLGAFGAFTVNTTFESGSGATAWPGIGTATAKTGQALTFPSTDLASTANLYCFNITGGITSTGAVGPQTSAFAYIQTNSAGQTPNDLTYWGVNIITDDQVVVTAVVAPTFNMTLSGNTDTFATNLDSTAVNTSNGARTVSVATNALNGWNVWVKGTNSKAVTDANTGGLHGALTSVTAGNYAISNNTASSFGTKHAFSAGAEDYGLAVTIASGTPTLSTAYNGTTANEAGTIDPSNYRPIASTASASASATLNIKMLTTISNTTPPAADYTDTLTYVGAGQF